MNRESYDAIAHQWVAVRNRLVTGVDQSASMLELARLRLPEQTWVQSTLEEFEPEGSYSAVIAWDSLFHIPRVHHATIWRRVRAVLPAEGRFALTLGGMEHPAFTDSMFDRTFFYDSHAPETALLLLEEERFSIVCYEFLNVPTTGRDKGRIAIVASAA